MHAPAYLRDALQHYLDCDDQPSFRVDHDGQQKPLAWLIGRLWRCTDVMRSEYCDKLDIPKGSTYAHAVQKLKTDAGRNMRRRDAVKMCFLFTALDLSTDRPLAENVVLVPVDATDGDLDALLALYEEDLARFYEEDQLEWIESFAIEIGEGKADYEASREDDCQWDLRPL